LTLNLDAVFNLLLTRKQGQEETIYIDDDPVFGLSHGGGFLLRMLCRLRPCGSTLAAFGSTLELMPIHVAGHRTTSDRYRMIARPASHLDIRGVIVKQQINGHPINLRCDTISHAEGAFACVCLLNDYRKDAP
jgi:hypothetical protein